MQNLSKKKNESRGEPPLPRSMPINPIRLRHTVSVLSRSNKKNNSFHFIRNSLFMPLPFIRPFVLFLKSLSNNKALLLFERSEL